MPIHGHVMRGLAPSGRRVLGGLSHGMKAALTLGMSSLPPSSLSGATPLTVPPPARCPAQTGGTSWTALLADTTWGMSGLGRRRVKVRQRNHGAAREGLRLV